MHVIKPKLIPQQGCFRPERNCNSHILGLTQYIEHGFQKKMVTGAVFIDMTAAYETVSTPQLIKKLY